MKFQGMQVIHGLGEYRDENGKLRDYWEEKGIRRTRKVGERKEIESFW